VVSADLVLGLDVGTTSSKAAVITPDGVEVAHGRAPMPWRRVPTGAEIDPAQLLDAACASARAALAQAPPGRVLAVGVASMAETGVLLDRRGEPVAPAIAWHDSRGQAEAERLAAEVGSERVAAHTGLRGGPLCTLVKHRWRRDHHPDEAARGVRWLNVAEFIVRGLGGEETAELSLASRTGMLDVVERAWWDEALAWAGASADLLPDPAPAGTPAGTVTAEPAATRGVERAAGAVLTVGGHDHLSAAVGAGADAEGDVLDSCGTAEAFVRAVAPLPRERIVDAVAAGVSVGWHVAPGLHALLASVRSGAILARVLALLGIDPGDRGDIEAAARLAPADAGGLELHGLRSEHLTLAGIGREPSPALAYRAALEAVGAAGAGLLAAMGQVAGPAQRLVTTGGWAEGEATRAVKARHLGPSEHAATAFAGARGAALTAARAAGAPRADTAVGTVVEEGGS
jgi:sugar (pentulose or hexulose) kinase